VAGALRFYQKLKDFTYVVSLGKQRSLLFYISTEEILKISFSLEGAALDDYRDFAGDGIFRVYIGLEAPENL
jgi:cystathionine beta-lyase/cystathionine gamma-synthase